MPPKVSLPDDPLWYRDAVIYELHVRAFFDGDGDGVGDFRGLSQKLDYLQDLGVSAIWLLPFYPSPLKDDGYDIADYNAVHSKYGTLQDFRAFLREAHKRNLRVITELVINHTSDQHPWFQRARKAEPGSKERDFYVWSDGTERYDEARIIFKDFEASNWSWDPVAKANYWHRFYHHQPDLNFANPEVHKALYQALDFWLGMGVDGLRLDAVPYLYERDDTNCENLPETHAFLKALRKHVDHKYRNRMLLAEANQWPEDAAAYFGAGDECHMCFHFPIMPRMFMAIHMEDRFPILDILEQTPAIPGGCQWALFLRNHDELTLEMVTDEERDYMYRVYAHDPQARINLGIRRRLAPLLGNNRRRIELMNGLLFSLPGTPVIYYGDEIGMGDNMYLGDRNGVRTPMQWSPDRNAGFSRANPQKLYLPTIIDPEYHYESLNVESQRNNPNSLFWWMKRLIGLRKRYKAFGRGTVQFLQPENRKVLAFLRRHEDEMILVVANLSRFAQCAELDLAEYNGLVPVELFGRTEFPPIGVLPYFITLGPHGFYWFALEAKRAELEGADGGSPLRLPLFEVEEGERELLRGAASDQLAEALPGYLRQQRWFAGKARRIKSTAILEVVPMTRDESVSYFVLLEAEYLDGDPEIYALPLTLARRSEADRIWRTSPRSVVAQVRWRRSGEVGLLYDASNDPEFCQSILDTIARRRRPKGEHGEIQATGTGVFREIRGDGKTPLRPKLLQGEQSNTSVIFGDRLVLKLFRRLGDGLNPDLEVGRYLTEHTDFRHIAPVAGYLEYRTSSGSRMTLAILKKFVPNEGDAWRYTLDHLDQVFEDVLARSSGTEPPAAANGETLLDRVEAPDSSLAEDLFGAYLESMRLLGRRTAEMHRALASPSDDPAFAPEPITSLSRRSLYQSMRNLTNRVMDLLRRSLPALREPARSEAAAIRDLEDEILERFRAWLDVRVEATRIRCHGDYHLGQVLWTGKDFCIIDFEGEPSRTLGERKLKRSPFRDVAGMLRSFQYAAHTAMVREVATGSVNQDRVARLVPWGRFWCDSVSAAFLRSYLEVVRETPLLPPTRAEVESVLRVSLLEKAMYELGYELGNRPDWVRIPIAGIRELIRVEASA